MTNPVVPATISAVPKTMPAVGGAKPTRMPTRSGPETKRSSSATPSRL